MSKYLGIHRRSIENPSEFWAEAAEGIDWDPHEVLAPLDGSGRVVMRSDDMLEQMLDAARPGDHVVFMSNAGFDAVPSRFCKALRSNERD